MTLLVYALAWLPMLGLAVINGVIRETVYGPYLPELAAHQLSSLTAVFLFAAYALWLGRVRPLASALQAVLAGILWLGLTVAFEFFMVVMLQGRPLTDALDDYDLASGRVWVLVLVAVAVLPWAVRRFGAGRR
ncbi:hypothetical protein GKC30_06050 [Pseudodesulfovibrio sp. F-1]|uniref:Uncharacterized protein n=1 Tax=Pseudodesulfovibrio alkaliphilus TaxID=2661613 RepID=A0A7K1KMM4_9BACT|nr:hypothetical protein [Pseudodesulfovibrio alkaliphilus]MUM77191.1 hypothetical protein [Pseudodesulfovibrio alkaliphilus]